MKLWLLPLILATGCAYNRPFLLETTTTTEPDGTVTVAQKRLTMSSYVLWPGSSEFAKQKATLGKTMGVGTDGLNQEGGGTNVVAALHELNSILEKVK